MIAECVSYISTVPTLPAAGEEYFVLGTCISFFLYGWYNFVYARQVSNIRRTLLWNLIVDHSAVVGASPVGAAPTTSSIST